MNQQENSSATEQAVSLQAVGNYVAPGLPTNGAVRMFVNKFKQRFSTKTTEPFIADDQHSKASADKLHGVAATPSCGPLQAELDRALDPWVSSGVSSVKVVILPPCDESNVIETWAQERQFKLIIPPSRQSLIAISDFVEPDLTGVGVAVIPRLERWFLRRHDGLHAIRALLKSLDEQECKCVIGCNSWAWAFLSKSLKVDLVLATGQTIVPYNGARLHAWLSELALSDGEQTISFRSTQSGENVFDIAEDGTLKCDYIKELASRSYGIPWVAWHLWRNSIRSVDNEQLKKTRSKLGKSELDQHTTWLAPLIDMEFPPGSRRKQLLVLHALLLHDSLTYAELTFVLNSDDYSDSVAVLIGAGFIKLDKHNMSCHPLVYGAVRGALSSAGYSMDKL